MDSLSKRMRMASWVAPGVVLAPAFAFMTYSSGNFDPPCDSGCAQGMIFMGAVALPALYLLCALLFPRLAVALAGRKRLSAPRFLLIGAALGSAPELPSLMTAVWLRSFVIEELLTWALLVLIVGMVSIFWWVLAFGVRMHVSKWEVLGTSAAAQPTTPGDAA
jgi:hypothetical protein